MTKGLMERYLHHEMTLGRVREKEGSYKKSGREEEGDEQRCYGDGFEQALSKEETVA